MSESFSKSTWTQPDDTFEIPLRPQSLKDFIGQKPVHDKLEIFIGAAKKRKETLGHSLFYGPPGLGKTTLAAIIANTMGTKLVTTSGPVIEKAGDLAGLLTSLQEGDVLFIDEIHRLHHSIEEYLYPAMEDFCLDLLIDSGPSARSVQVKLNKFTLVGATTRVGLLSAPLRSRFAFNCKLDYYDNDVLSQIILRSASLLHMPIDEEGALEIAKRSRGTPRIANNLLRWVRDFVEIRSLSKIDRQSAAQALEILSIDHKGLDQTDKKILETIIDHHQGGPVGVSTIAVAIGEDPFTIAEVYEPYLIMQGFLKRTQRGREATLSAYEHMNKKAPQHLYQGNVV